MDAILLKPKDSEELKLIAELLAKMKVSSKILSEEDLENSGLGMMMKEVDRNETVSREDIFKTLDF
ncbi:MAG: hypothetical protein ABIP95_01995 [Pelobium sp.]